MTWIFRGLTENVSAPRQSRILIGRAIVRGFLRRFPVTSITTPNQNGTQRHTASAQTTVAGAACSMYYIPTVGL